MEIFPRHSLSFVYIPARDAARGHNDGDEQRQEGEY